MYLTAEVKVFMFKTDEKYVWSGHWTLNVSMVTYFTNSTV